MGNVSTVVENSHGGEPNWEPEDFPIRVVMRRSKWHSDPRLKLDLEKLRPSTRRRAPSVPKALERRPTASALGKRPVRIDNSLHLKPVLKPISKGTNIAGHAKPPRAAFNASASFYKPDRFTPLKGSETSLLDASQASKSKLPSRLRIKS